MNNLLNNSDTYLRSDLFDGLTKKEQIDILDAGQRDSISPGATLFREGESAFRCDVVQTGRLKPTKLHEEGNDPRMVYLIMIWQGPTHPLAIFS